LVDAGLLKVIAWSWNTSDPDLPRGEFNDPGRFAEFQSSGTSGLAWEIAALGDIGQTTFDVYVTAHTGVGTYRKLLKKDQGKRHVTFIAWRANFNTEKIKKQDEVILKGDFDHIALAPAARIAGQHGDRFVAAMRDGSKKLKLMVWGVAQDDE
jgi:hypothetical protein